MLTVLVVEDSPPVGARMVRELVSVPGVHVLGLIASPSEALVRFRSGVRPDVLLLDLQLLGGHGLSLLETGLVPRGTLVFVHSSFADEATRAACLRAGASDVFDKTLGMDLLLARLAALTSDRTGGAGTLHPSLS